MKIPIALDKTTREIKVISMVERGLNCNCICPACESLLIAKKGTEKVAHFAHYRSKEGPDCRESAVHLMAKYILRSQENIALPTITVNSDKKHSLLREPFQEKLTYWETPQSIFDAKEEVSLPNYGIKPDILCAIEIQGIRYHLAIEVAVTHKSEDFKRNKLEDANLSTVEIDLSDLLLLQSVTFADIERALTDKSRMEWLHINTEIIDHLKNQVDTITSENLAKRNKQILTWHQSLYDHLLDCGKIKIPTYKFSATDLQEEVIDISNKTHKINIPNPPNIGGHFNFLSASSPVNGEIILTVEHNGRPYKLPALLIIGESDPQKPQGSYLKSCSEDLPDVEMFELTLSWGRSERANHYLKEINRARTKTITLENSKIEKEIERKVAWLTSIQIGETSPDFRNAKKTSRDYWSAKEELERKSINTEDITTKIVDGWIFGCQTEYWQTILFRTICLVENEDVNIRYYHDNLNKYHGIHAIEPVRSLTFLNQAASALGYNIEIPTAFGVISQYFRYLKETGYLSHAGRGHYRKMMPYGRAYKNI